MSEEQALVEFMDVRGAIRAICETAWHEGMIDIRDLTITEMQQRKLARELLGKDSTVRISQVQNPFTGSMIRLHIADEVGAA